MGNRNTIKQCDSIIYRIYHLVVIMQFFRQEYQLKLLPLREFGIKVNYAGIILSIIGD